MGHHAFETGYGIPEMSAPDYIIIGAMKCATSTLAVQLGGQKGIFMTSPKEPNYFSDDAIFAKGAEWYASLFASAAPGDIKGEASTHYTKRPELDQTLARMVPAVGDVKLIYMIRNPMVRLVSHYIHEWSEGRLSGSLEAAIDTYTPLIDYGRYGWQITPFIEAFGTEPILLTSLERLTADPETELSRIARHIGHSGPVTWMKEDAAQNVSSERVRRLPLQGVLVDNPVATYLRRNLVPKGIRNRIRAMRQMKDRPEIPPHQRASLETCFAQDRDLLAAAFPDDPSLKLAYPFLA